MDTQQAQTGARVQEQSKGRRIAFRVVAILVALFILAQMVFGLLEIVFMWFPAETVADMFDEKASNIALHRTHFMAIGILAWGIVLSMLLQLRKPERRVAPMLLVVGAAIGGTIVFGLSGTLSEWLIEEILAVAIPVSLVVFLHPSRYELFTRPHFEQPLAWMAVLAAASWLVYIVDNAWTQFTNAAGDPHAEMEHWGIAALMGIVLSVAAFLGASDKTGWRFTGWYAALGSVIFGVHSLVFPGLASALPAIWAVAAILWGIVFAAMIVQKSRTDATTQTTAA